MDVEEQEMQAPTPAAAADELVSPSPPPIILPNASVSLEGYPPRRHHRYEDVERIMEEQLRGYTIHARARRQRVLEMLNNYDSMVYASLATSQSIETIKFKLLRLLNPLAEDSPEAEAEHLMRIMTRAGAEE